MTAASELRATLHQSSDWSKSLRDFAERLSARAESEHTSEPALVLAQAFEAIEPDRSHAVRMHLLAWRTRPVLRGALRRARELCREIGNLELAATIAGLDYEQQEDPKLAYAEGIAWLDANQPERAVDPLTRASRSLGNNESLRIALATAKREWSDANQVVATLIRDAQAASDLIAAADRYLCAARIDRICGSEGDRYGNVLRYAFRANPQSTSTYGLLEDWLIARGDRDGLLEVYRYRARLPRSAAELVEEYRRAGTKLVLQEYLQGLGLRLLERSVAHSYESGLTEIPGLIASLSLMRRYADEADSQIELLKLLAEGLGRALPSRDLLWMAMTGLDVSWRGLGNENTGRAYAAIVAEHAPEHPLLGELLAASNSDHVLLDQWVANAPAESDEARLPRKIGLDAALQNQAEQPPEPPAAEEQFLTLMDLPPDTSEQKPETSEQKPDTSEQRPDTSKQTPETSEPKPSLIPSGALLALQKYRHKPLVPTPDRQPLPVRERARRMLLPADVRVSSEETGDDLALSAITRDLSTTGLFLVTETLVPVGTTLHISLQLPGDDEWSLCDLELTGRVVRQVDHGLGVDFVSPPAEAVRRIEQLIDGDVE